MINGKKLIEIRKLGFINKGAELMLYAILEKMRKEFPDAKFAMVSSLSTGNAAYLKRAELGLYQKAHIWRKGVQFGILANLIPAKIREVFGIVLDKEVDIVIDGAGFLYSDQMGKYSCLELSNSCKRWKRNGTKVILLPQAFGPFESYYENGQLKEEGFSPTDSEYYTEIDRRMKETFPHKFGGEVRKQEPTSQPAQVVAGASRSSPGSSKKVKLSKEDIRLANKWNVPLEQYAQEKLKADRADGEYTTINTQRGGK